MPFDTHKPEPGSSLALGGREGMKEAIEHFAVHAGTVVGHGDGHARAAGRIVARPNADHKTAMARQRVQRIADQVGHYLAEFSGMVKHLWSCAVAALQS